MSRRRSPPYINVRYLPGVARSVPGPPGATFEDVAFSPDGSLVAAVDNTNNQVHVFEAVTGNVLHSYATGAGPFTCAWSRNGKRIFVVNNTDETVSQIDYPSGTTVTHATTGSNASGIVVTKNDLEIIVSNASSSNLSRIVLATSAVTLIPVPAGAAQISITPDGKFVMSPNITANSISRVRLSDNNVTSQALATQPDYFRCNTDNRTAWLTVQGNNELKLIEISTLATLKTISFNAALPGYFTQDVQPSPDGSAVYLLNCDPTFTFCVLLTINADTSVFVQQPGTFAAWLSISPDGQTLASGSFSTGNLDLYPCYGSPA